MNLLLRPELAQVIDSSERTSGAITASLIDSGRMRCAGFFESRGWNSFYYITIQVFDVPGGENIHAPEGFLK